MRAEQSVGQSHRDACTVRPSPAVAFNTSDETFAETVDFDQPSIAARTAAINQGVHTAPLGRRFNRRFYLKGASLAAKTRRALPLE